MESGNLLNKHYNEPARSNISIDYIGPSIDTGFRLTGFSSGRKMVVSVDAAYLLSMTNSDGEIKRLDIYYDGLAPLKGVLGGAAYPIFWINMSAGNSLAVKEDKLKAQTACNREDIKDFCDSFYQEHEQYTFHPFIKAEKGQPLSNAPSWYDDYHAGLVKNFQTPDSDYTGDDSKTSSETSEEHDPSEIENFVRDIPKRNEE